MFACEQAGVVPDIITLSKALTGGTLPLAATVARKHVFEAFWSDDPQKALMHGPTYMGNALACAAANASLDLFEREPRLDAGRGDLGSRWRASLAPCRGLPGVKDVRVKGAIGVVEMERIGDLEALRARFVEEGVFIRPFGAIIYLTPAFTIEPDELSRLTGGDRQGGAAKALQGDLNERESKLIRLRRRGCAAALLAVAGRRARAGIPDAGR